MGATRRTCLVVLAASCLCQDLLNSTKLLASPRAIVGLNVSRQFHIWVDGKLCPLLRR